MFMQIELILINHAFFLLSMHRRSFLQISALSGGFSLVNTPFSWASPSGVAERKPAWLLEWVKINDDILPNYVPLRITDPKSQAFGGFKDADDIPNVHSTSSFVQRSLWAVATPESAYYQSKTQLYQVELALKYLLKAQHQDGTIDLLTTNFHSTPDTGFLVNYLSPTYRLVAATKTTEASTVLNLLKTFLQRAGEALIVGGIHTPNHRWVVSAGLANLYQIWPDSRYRQRAEQWLAEHIDIDPDGQYNEKSSYIYSPLTNRVLLTVAKGFNKPELIDVVRRNLQMTMYYVHPNGEVVTEASGRQDKAVTGTMEGYYQCYRFMALHDNSGEMAAMCRLIEKMAGKKIASYMDAFLEDPILWKELPPSAALPTHYARAFTHSGVVRIRRGEWDTTILAKNPTWLTFHKGNAVLQGMRIAASFFGKGQFQSEKIEQIGNSWVLTSSLEGPYYQPFDAAQIAPDGDWEKMPRDKRPQSEVQKLTTTIKITETDQGVEIELSLTGTDGVPVALELMFRAGGTLAGVMPHPTRDKAFLLHTDEGSYTVGTDSIRFGRGRAEHKNVQLRGALPFTDTPTVFLTGFTPFQHTIKLS